MSAEAVGWVYRHSPYSGVALLVHLAIADTVNDQHNNELWMAQATLARKVRAGRPAVNSALAKLLADGFLVLVTTGATKGKPNCYRFVFPDAEVVYETRFGGVVSGNTPPAGVSSEATGGVVSDNRGVSSEATQTQEETQVQSQEVSVSTEVDGLVGRLAAAVAVHQGHKPKTGAWAKPLDLLLRRGAPEWADPAPIPVAEVEAMIDLVFTAGTVRSGDRGFCWADQVRSGEALRRHWSKLVSWRERSAHRSSNASVVGEVLAAFEGAGVTPGTTFGLVDAPAERKAL